MRLIAVLGVLFVLASCSDMDINGNNKFAVACVYETDKDNENVFHLEFDGNTVKRYDKPLKANQPPSTYKIKSDSNVSPLIEIWDDTGISGMGRDGEIRIYNLRYTLDKQTLKLHRETLDVTDNMGNPVELYSWQKYPEIYNCKKSQI